MKTYSIVAITNQSGQVVEKRLFDAWGLIVKVQDIVGNVLTGLVALDRGYTGHEHLQGVNLIHMNGRLYDPLVHRFLQPDNFVQELNNTQNFNRYGYVMNNPTKYTDESGEFWGYVIGALFTAYAQGYATTGDYNPMNWGSDTWLNAGLGVLSSAASSVATYYADNYITNYGNNDINFETENNSNYVIKEQSSYQYEDYGSYSLSTPYDPKPFGSKGLAKEETDAATYFNMFGGVIFSESAKYIKENAKIGRFDYLNQVDFLNNAPKAQGWLYDTEVLKYSKYVGTYGGAFANNVGYIGAVNKFYNGDAVGGSIDAAANRASIWIGKSNPWLGMFFSIGWNVGWGFGESLSKTEIYNRFLFGSDSSIYHQREHYWWDSKILKN